MPLNTIPIIRIFKYSSEICWTLSFGIFRVSAISINFSSQGYLTLYCGLVFSFCWKQSLWGIHCVHCCRCSFGLVVTYKTLLNSCFFCCRGQIIFIKPSLGFYSISFFGKNQCFINPLLKFYSNKIIFNQISFEGWG